MFGNVGIKYPAPEDYWNPNAGGGPISRTPLVAARANAGNVVYRSPNTIVLDAEPGASDWSYLRNKIMLPDGRLVDADSEPNPPYEPLPWSTPLDSGLGAAPAPAPATTRAVALVATGALGAVYGSMLTGRPRTMGIVAGGLLGMTFGLLAIGAARHATAGK